jgi:protease I
VTAVGGKYVDVPPTGPNAVHVDGRLVSAKGWPGLAAFMRECLRALGTEIVHREATAGGAAARPPRSTRARAKERASADA